MGLLVLYGLLDDVSHHCLCFISLGGDTSTLWPGGWCQSSLSLFYFSRWAYLYFVAWWMVVVVVVNFIKHQNRAITGERVAARAAPSYQYAMVLVIIT